MTTEIGKLNTVIIKPTERPDSDIKVSTVDTDAFLSLTNRFGLGNGLSKVEKKDVISGAVADEINKIQTEQDQITSIINANSKKTFSTLSDVKLAETVQSNAKTIGFVKYSGSRNINAKTDTTAIKNCIVSNNATEKQLISDSIDLLCDWLDNYIANYDSKITEGLNRGDSELKQSFLLRIRQAIENMDFGLGFGDYSDPDDENTLGSYSFANTGYDTLHLNVNRSLLLNAKYFMPERPYSSLDEIKTALANGDIEVTDLVTNPVMFLVDDEAYSNYCKNYIASTLVHEIVHSTHIYDEAITYFTNDCFDDDFYNQDVSGFSQETLSFMQALGAYDISYESGATSTVDYTDGIQYGDLLISHNLNGFNDAVEHGWQKIQDNPAFATILPQFTSKEDCRKELLNFAVTA